MRSDLSPTSSLPTALSTTRSPTARPSIIRAANESGSGSHHASVDVGYGIESGVCCAKMGSRIVTSSG